MRRATESSFVNDKYASKPTVRVPAQWTQRSNPRRSRTTNLPVSRVTTNTQSGSPRAPRHSEQRRGGCRSRCAPRRFASRRRRAVRRKPARHPRAILAVSRRAPHVPSSRRAPLQVGSRTKRRVGRPTSSRTPPSHPSRRRLASSRRSRARSPSATSSRHSSRSGGAHGDRTHTPRGSSARRCLSCPCASRTSRSSARPGRPIPCRS